MAVPVVVERVHEDAQVLVDARPVGEQRQVFAIRVGPLEEDAALLVEAVDQGEEKVTDRLGEFAAGRASQGLLPVSVRQTLALFGEPYPVSRVRMALFNAALRFTPLDLD